MNRRLRKKLHARHADYVLLIVQEPKIHLALAASPVDKPWSLTAELFDQHLPRRWGQVFRRWNLHFLITRIQSIPGASDLSMPAAVPFKAWAAEFPELCVYGWNGADCSSLLHAGEEIDATFIPGAPVAVEINFRED